MSREHQEAPNFRRRCIVRVHVLDYAGQNKRMVQFLPTSFKIEYVESRRTLALRNVKERFKPLIPHHLRESSSESRKACKSVRSGKPGRKVVGWSPTFPTDEVVDKILVSTQGWTESNSSTRARHNQVAQIISRTLAGKLM